MTLNLSTSYCFVFVLQNWAYGIFIYSVAYAFSFKNYMGSKGYNLSDFESTTYFILSLLVINTIRIFTTIQNISENQLQQRASIKRYLVKLAGAVLFFILLYFLVYLFTGSGFRYSGWLKNLSTVLPLFTTLALSIGVPVFFDCVILLWFKRWILNPLRTQLETYVFSNVESFIEKVEHVKERCMEQVVKAVESFRNHDYIYKYRRLKQTLWKANKNHPLHPCIIKMLQIDGLTSNSEISSFTLGIVNSSKNKMYEVFSKETERPIFQTYLPVMFLVQLTKLICLIVIGFTGDRGSSRINLFLNTPIPYSMLIYGVLTLYFRKFKDSILDSVLPLLGSISLVYLIELIISFAISSYNRNNDITEIEIQETKLLSSPLNLTVVHFYILTPISFIVKTLR